MCNRQAFYTQKNNLKHLYLQWRDPKPGGHLTCYFQFWELCVHCIYHDTLVTNHLSIPLVDPPVQQWS